MGPDTIHGLLDKYTPPMHQLETAMTRAQWELATTGSEEAQREAVRLEVEYKSLFADESDYRQIQHLYGAREGIADPGLRRQVEILRLSFLANRDDPALAASIAELSAKVESRYMNFRASLGGHPVSDNELRRVLRTTTDSDQARLAWQASKLIGQDVAADVVRLAELRNESARREGFSNYHERSLAAQEIDRASLFALLDELEEETREPFRRAKSELDETLARRFGVSVEQLRPWHYGEPFFQEPPLLNGADTDALYDGKDLEDVAVSTFGGMRLDVKSILARSDLYEREHKDQHAFCTHIDRMSQDVRILCNLRPNQYWAATILHELGHAVYDQYLDPDLPFLLHDIAHTSTTEAIAMLMGRLIYNAAWLTAHLGVTDGEARRLAGSLAHELRLSMLIFIRWALVMVHFERALYDNPRRDDLNALWWDLAERFQMVRRPDGRDEPDWAAKVHVALYPAYYQNYVLGELTASQLQQHLTADTGGLVDVPEVGDWLRSRVFRLGARYPWDETVKQATGQVLHPSYFAEQFIR